jgi:hypothetical protein
MSRDFTIFLWLLKLGALVNLYFLANTFSLAPERVGAEIVLPAQILFAVSAFRCLFPVWYKNNIVFHDSPLSSIFLTRLLATFAEVAFIFQFSEVIRLLNSDHVGWVDMLSWLMVIQVVVSQLFVWGAIFSGRLALYFYEEFGWAVIFAANTIASGYLYWTVDALGAGAILVQLNLLFGLGYLPWQINHLRVLHLDARESGSAVGQSDEVSWAQLVKGLRESLITRNKTSDSEAWGGFVGLTWMACYWATLIPMWLNQVVQVFTTG